VLNWRIQFLLASNIQSSRGNPPSIVGSLENSIAHDDAGRRRPRSRSVTRAHEKGAEEVENRMRHTVDYLKKDFKPNTRGHFVQHTFASLEDILRNVLEDIGFDMEIIKSRPLIRARLSLMCFIVPTYS